MEIKLTSCSNIHLFKQIHLFLSQNTIPIEITTSPIKKNEKEKKKEKQSGGSGSEKEKIEKAKDILQSQTNVDPTHLIYKPAYTPGSVIYQFFDRIFLQKQNDTLHDQQNQTLLNSVLNKKNIITDTTIGLETLSKPNPKKNILPPEPSSLFVHIETNHPNPMESIKGTKLYYLIQRTGKCAHLV